MKTAGNTDVSTLNVGEKLILRAGKWEHRQQAGSVYGAQDGEQTSNLLFGNWRSDFALNAWLAVFGYAGYDRNAFAGISRRSEETLGLAAKLMIGSTGKPRWLHRYRATWRSRPDTRSATTTCLRPDARKATAFF